MAAAKRSVLSSLAVYAEDSDPESDSEAGTAGGDGGAPTGEGRQGAGTGGGLGRQGSPVRPAPAWRFSYVKGRPRTLPTPLSSQFSFSLPP